MSETVINIVILGVIIAAVLVGIFSPLFALLIAFWKWYRESGGSTSGQVTEAPQAGATPRSN